MTDSVQGASPSSASTAKQPDDLPTIAKAVQEAWERQEKEVPIYVALRLANAVLQPTRREVVEGDELPAGMVKIKEMIADLQSIMDRFGNTCVYIKPGVSWGATAMWRRDDATKAIEETAVSFAAKFKPEYKELAQQIMEHAISEGWTHKLKARQPIDCQNCGFSEFGAVCSNCGARTQIEGQS